MPKPRPPLLGAALRFLRFAGGWSEAELAEALAISPDLISKYEKGRKPLSRERLEELLVVMNVPPEAIDGCLYAYVKILPRPHSLSSMKEWSAMPQAPTGRH